MSWFTSYGPTMIPKVMHAGFYRGDLADAETYVRPEWLIYKYDIGCGVGWVPLMKVFAADQDYAYVVAKRFYNLKEGEMLEATKDAKHSGDWDSVSNPERK
jgi:hypothetical protein